MDRTSSMGKDRRKIFKRGIGCFQIMPNHMHGIIVLNDAAPVGATLAVALADAPDAPADNTIDPNNNPDTNNIGISNNIGTRVNRVPTNDPISNDIGTRVNRVPTKDPVSNDHGIRVNRVPTLGDILGAYKSLVANDCLKLFKLKYPGKIMGKLWHRNYYEHIIRDEQALLNIRQYIIDNPIKWSKDKLNPLVASEK